MQDEAEITVERLLWEESNLAHCARHGVTPLVVAEVKDGSPRFWLNDPHKTGTHMMVGPDATGRFWTIVILAGGHVGDWKPITGWPSTPTEVKEYNTK